MLTYGSENGISLKIQSALQQIQRELADTVAITRSLSVEMSPVVLHGEGLADAILWLGSQMKEQFGLQVELTPKDDFNYLEDHMRVLLFRAVRELLFNIVKHAHVTQATVSLAQVEDQLRITVSDAGAGFDVSAVMSEPNTAHGLLVIRDRLSLMGGRMQVTSKLGKGTQVVIEIPQAANSD
jgi:signal transduction histidine kinase